MTIETKAPATAGEISDRVDFNLQELLWMEDLLWGMIRGEASVDKVNYDMLRLLGKLRKTSRRLRQKITEAGGG